MSDLGVETLIYTPPGLSPGSIDETPVTVTPTTLTGCQVYPRTATEASGRQSTTIIGYTALIPLGQIADLDSKGTLTWRGRVYDVEAGSEAGEWRYMDGSDAGLEVAMTRKRG